ncbi:AAA family ATPase [Helicobacter mehlei]|uniref:AAA family ATPase n=1 Tax=Helicobacter mehlei TaxID=2316080 RepID=UPI001F3DAF93|nr:AAA family ATPase [Helicobacter mehlei]
MEDGSTTTKQKPQDTNTSQQGMQDGDSNQLDKGKHMGKSKKDMDVCGLKRHLILQRAGCLAWMADHAYKNFGWVALTPLHQARGSHLAWERITADQDRYVLEGAEELEWLQKYPYRAYYFFRGICAQRQEVQRVIIFKDSAEVLNFLLNLYKPYAHFDPKFSQHQTMVNLNLEADKEKNRARFLYEQTLQSWSYSFENTLHKICLKTPTQVKIPLSSLPFCPKTLAPVLEKYRWGDTYIFQTTYTPPPNLPKFDPEILLTSLSKSLKLLQEHLEECMQNLVPPQRKPKFKRKVRKQLAKLCFAQHHGLITPEYIEHFKLHDPEDPEAIKAVAQVYIAQNFPSFKDKIAIPEESEYFALRRFTLNDQKHYYMEQALWVWAYQRLLEIFNNSLENREVKDQLLARLNPVQACEFEQAFYENLEEKQGVAIWSLIEHLALPLAVLQQDDQVVIAKNPHFKPATFLNESAHHQDILRLLFFFGRVLSEENASQLLQMHRDIIPVYPHVRKDMGFHALKIYLLKQKAGCLCWIADQAYKNFGWVSLNHEQQAQGMHIAWEYITEEQIYQRQEAHYFFAGIYAQRQAKQRRINFQNAQEVIAFLVELFKPFATHDPNHVSHLSAAHDTMQYVDVDMEHFGARLYEEILKEWEPDFVGSLEKALKQTPTHAIIATSDLPFLTKETELALEKYRQGDNYIFQTTYTPPSALPSFDRSILAFNLKESLKVERGALAGVVDSLARPKNNPTLKRKTRKQIAKLRLQETYGILTPNDFENFHLDYPKAKSFLNKHRFKYQGQECYYFEYALNIWVLQRLLEIFEGSIAMQEVEHALLARLNPAQALEFTSASSQKYASTQNITTTLASHLNLPLSIVEHSDSMAIVPNPAFKPHVFLNHSPHSQEILRLLLDFKNCHKESKEPTPTTPRLFTLVPKALEGVFSQLCIENIDVHMEALFFDDKPAFVQKILDLQRQFLKEKTNFEENFLEWCAAHLESANVPMEDKKGLIQKIIEIEQRLIDEQATLEKAFATWWAENMHIELEALFFDDKPAFFQIFLAMQTQFFQKNLIKPQEPKIATPTQEPPPPKTLPTPKPQDKYSPKAIKSYLDQFVIGQENAKKQMSLVFSDHYKRIQGQSGLEKANAICIGPSGSGKTFLIEMATQYLDIPYCLVNAASLTPTGYRGEETNQMFAMLYNNADKNIEKAEQGVLVLDEIDKLGQGGWSDKEWRQGVQNELLKVIEKGIVSFEYGNGSNKQTISLKTDHMLFIVLGHFEKLWKNNQSHQKLPKITNENLIECGMKREFLRRFCVRVIFEPVDIDMLTELLDRRLKPFQEEFFKAGSALEFSPEAKRFLVKNALKEGVGMSGLDQKLHELLMPLRFDLEDYNGLKCVINGETLENGEVFVEPLDCPLD